MTAFRVFLAIFFVCLLAYTGIVIAHHGPNLFPIFFGDMAAMGWPGQFNADFMGFLMLSGLWLAWRNGFTPGAIGLGIAGSLLGMSLLAPYLLIVSLQAKGDMKEILLGRARANGQTAA